MKPEATIIIVSYKTRKLTSECLNIVKNEIQNCEVIVVDNGSNDDTEEYIREHFPEVKLIVSKVNLGFACANNLAFKEAKGRYLILLNSDAFPHPGAIMKSINKMDDNPQVGLAGGRLVGEDGSWQPSGRMFPSMLNDFLYLSGLAIKYPRSTFFGRSDRTWAPQEAPSEVDWVPGAYSIIRKDLLDQIGFFDENFFLYYEEVDLCRRIKQAGYQVWYWPDVIVTHIGGETAKMTTDQDFSETGSQLTLWRMRSALLYFRKFHGYIGALRIRMLEEVWHRLRALKNQFYRSEGSQLKVAQSRKTIALMRQAWKETQGGKVSPPKPW